MPPNNLDSFTAPSQASTAAGDVILASQRAFHNTDPRAPTDQVAIAEAERARLERRAQSIKAQQHHIAVHDEFGAAWGQMRAMRMTPEQSDVAVERFRVAALAIIELGNDPTNCMGPLDIIEGLPQSHRIDFLRKMLTR